MRLRATGLLLLVLCTILLVRCGRQEPDYQVGPTAVYLEPGAAVQLPDDFFDGLAALQNFLGDGVMQGELVLYPNDALIAGHRNYNGLTEGHSIGVRLLGDSVLRTALVHEYTAHRACRVVYSDGNASHENITCKQLEEDAGNFVQERLETR